MRWAGPNHEHKISVAKPKEHGRPNRTVDDNKMVRREDGDRINLAKANRLCTQQWVVGLHQRKVISWLTGGLGDLLLKKDTAPRSYFHILLLEKSLQALFPLNTSFFYHLQKRYTVCSSKADAYFFGNYRLFLER